MFTFLSRKPFQCLLAGVVAAVAVVPHARAEYPDKPIKYVLSAGAGSGPDSLMRLVLQDVGKRLGQTIVVDNRPGGGGLIAMQSIANAAPDGYTIGHGNTQTLGINPSMNKASKTAADHVQLIVQVGYTPNLLSVSPKLPVNSVKDLVAYGKSRPGKLMFASAGNGTSGHLSGELFKKMTGIEMIHVPYKTAPAGVNDVMAGHVDLVFDNLAGSLAAAKSGKLKALAVTGPKRSPLMPDLPTVSEAGVPQFEVVAWSGVIAPEGLPPAIAQKINTAVNQTLKDPHVIEGMRDLGYVIVGGTAADFSTVVKKERAKWGDIVKRSGAATD
ncbi:MULTISPECIES: Bug family tripartite tricarboxylate transporter substrate binding protein [Cupriavidus]|uniref:Bug family tripartite tricarboxylate transporter substrate binding protein n=1 Tax=Cupriavidus TaxID=106589 RepID=UPI0003B0535D|nr:hypothetical protein N234_26390 [Ralstonia pickettii DTP0602]